MDSDKEEICCEAIKVLANLTRHKDIIPALITYKIADALVLYLAINSKEVIFYVLGVLINIVCNNEIRIQFSNDIFSGVNQVINDCSQNESDLINLSMKVLANLIEDNKIIEKILSMNVRKV